MATKKKKPTKTMDIVAPKKKVNKIPITEIEETFAPEEPEELEETATEEIEEVVIETEPIDDYEQTLSEALNDAFPDDETDGNDENEEYEEEETIIEEKPMKKKTEPELAPKESVKKLPKEEPAPKKSNKKPLKIISGVLVLAATVSVGILIFNLSRSEFLPAKYFYPAVAALILIMLIFLRLTFRRKTKTATHIIIDLLSVVLLAASIFGNLKLGDTIAFLDENLNGTTYQTITYNVITGAESKYGSASELNSASIIAPPDFVLSEDELITEVKDQLGANLIFEENIDNVTNLPLTDSDALILLGDSIYSSITETNSDYGKQTKIIAAVKITKRIEKVADDNDLTSKPFLLFLSGIDTRGDDLPYTCLSDVNMVIAVNPKTANILLVTVPRDYYVQLPGTTGLRDKLTHAGSLGGVRLSEATVEDLLGEKFDDYVRVTFNFLIGLVDAVGGITIYSDSPFTAWTDRSCSFTVGDNFVDGECALAFARERKAYDTGDTHRAENQQQVFEKVFSKLSSSSTLIGKYSEILNSLSGTFETSLTSDDISGLVRYQLDNFPSWKIHSYTLAGTGGSDYTYSYPSQLLYVSYPDASSIAKAKQMIEEVLNGS